MKFKKLFFVVLIFSGFTACSTSPSTTSELLDKVSLADNAYTQSRWFEAARLYQQVIDEVPDDSYAWFRLANTQLQQGRTESAIFTYREALKREGNNSKVHFNLATAYMLNAIEEMQNALNGLRQNDPARELIESRINTLAKIIDQPVEVSHSPAPVKIHGYGRKQANR